MPELTKDRRYLMRRKDELLTERQRLLDRVVEEGRDFTDTERSKSQSLQNQVDRLDIQIREAEDIELQRAGIPRNRPRPTMQTGDLSPGMIVPGTRARNFGFLEYDYRTNHANLGEFVQDTRWGDLRERRGFQMSVGEQGGFLVPSQFIGDILMVTPEISIVRSRATSLPANPNAPDAPVGIPALDYEQGGFMGGVKVYWLAEGGEKPGASAKLMLIGLEPREVGAHTVITDKLLRNDSGAATAFLERVFRATIFDEEDYQFLCGDGVGKPLGVLNSDARIEVDRDTSEKFKFADVGNMLAKFCYDSWGRAVWVINATVLPELINMVDAGNHRVYVGADPSKGLPPSLMGIPTVFTGRTPTLGNAGDVMLCDFSYYLVKTGSGPFMQASEHFKFIENKTVVKTFYNVDGQPWLTVPITLRDGTTQVSPFVVLK